MRTAHAQGVPIDTATWRQAGSVVHDGTVDVLVGYLVTHADGYECRLPPDRTRAELYAARNRATLEALYVKRRIAKDDQIAQAAGATIGAAPMPG